MSHKGKTEEQKATALADVPVVSEIIISYLITNSTLGSSTLRTRLIDDALAFGKFNECFQFICEAGILGGADAIKLAYLLYHLPRDLEMKLAEQDELSEEQEAAKAALPRLEPINLALAFELVKEKLDIAHAEIVSDALDEALDDDDDDDDDEDDEDEDDEQS